MCFRLRASRILVIGAGGLGAEVAKNIVLAGVQEVTLLDHAPLKPEDSACRFLMQQEGANVRLIITFPLVNFLLGFI